MFCSSVNEKSSMSPPFFAFFVRKAVAMLKPLLAGCQEATVGAGSSELLV